MGKWDDAIRLTERAFELDRLSLTGFTNLAASYVNAGRLDEARALCSRALELQPDYPIGYYVRRLVQLRGDVEEARADFAKDTELSGDGEWGRLQSEALVQHAAGNDQASGKAAEEIEARFGAEDPLTCARLRAWRGEADAAFAWLDKALAAHDPYLASIKADNSPTSLHADPRWNALLKKIGLPTD